MSSTIVYSYNHVKNYTKPVTVKLFLSFFDYDYKTFKKYNTFYCKVNIFMVKYIVREKLKGPSL